MPNMTKNYNLVKPLQEESYDVDVFNGNCDILDALIKKIADRFIPHVGDTIITLDGTNPSSRYEGTTWKLLEEGTFIQAAGKTLAAGTSGGSNTATISVKNLPPHGHDIEIIAAGNHNHGRGTMNITGAFWGRDVQVSYNGNGAFYLGARGNWNDEGGDYHSDYPSVMNFDAQRSWTGRTSIDGNHIHDAYIKNTGGGQPLNIEPKNKRFYIWVRTA